ncbi:hypothetical protein [Sandaracinobacteroides saxicola]|uniref:Uncharacterized protein n=1 Tax=Sandaracinobacteroides saxicola TaxID=2759707 RepID=A0A7G5IKF8_9SPHN|nr:hypothetical protein [Sandaracinobacteroides saxicola]QMW23850.1 hypothetical protein H3309_05075 [Sandaracinobacteroides saxicola]
MTCLHDQATARPQAASATARRRLCAAFSRRQPGTKTSQAASATARRRLCAAFSGAAGKKQ